jgi:glycosyltransferase involved in cell wall biosynthesis
VDDKTTTLIDCRWLGFTGKGRVTEYLLEGLADLSPPGRWLLWGPPSTADFAWSGSSFTPSRHSPLAWAGQRDAVGVPKADAALFLHTVRPFTARRSVVLVHDTIPLRWAPTRARRVAWRAYLELSVRTAGRIMVYSDATRRRVAEDLGVHDVTRVHLPYDPARATRVRALRALPDRGTHPTMLYVGLVRPQKNLERAITAFASSTFRSDGGRFVIVGADETGRRTLTDIVRRTGTEGVDVVPSCTDEELDSIYARASFLIQPSLEEGFGLPVTEALTAGIPVCCSDIESLREAAGGAAETFDPFSVTAIRDAIDRTAASAAAGFTPEPLAAPTPTAFAGEVLGALSDLRPARSGRRDR